MGWGIVVAMRMMAMVMALSAACGVNAGAQRLIVVNQGDATASVIDPAAKRSVATIDEGVKGVHAHEAATTADGRTLFLPVYGSTGVGKPGVDGHEMLVIDVDSRKIVDHVEFGHGVRPHLPVLDAKRNVLWVTTELDKTVTAIDPKTHRILYAVPTGAEQSHMFALSPDGKYGYTANVGPGSVSVLDMNARKTVTVIPVAGSVQRISVTPDGKWVFTSDVAKPRLAAIDTGTKTVARWVELPAEGYGSAVTRDGKWLLIAIPTKNEVAVVDLKTMSVAKTMPTAEKPQEVLIAPDGKTAYVSCVVAGKVSVMDMGAWKTVGEIAAGPGADGLAWGR